MLPRHLLLAVLAMALVVIASNILVQFLLGDWLTYGALTYPFAFLITDITNRLYGAESARRVVYAGFAVGLACSLVGSQIDGPFGPLVSLRVAIGSATAFLLAQLLDVAVFSALRKRVWWLPPLVSSVLGSALDTALFFFIAFSTTLMVLAPGEDVAWANEVLPLLGVGPMAPLWVSLATADWLVKLTIAAIALIPFRLVVARLRPTENL